ncbi:ABC transporter substrate-binding protein [Gluconacetobacter entanii]|uniref:ABC transporter substrate-binding protein n=1 Tax=Gluconacetobacter entanii TaxID=108528 RepID=A0A318PZ59_9PROT|nr:ABC transporter substrate-binding protein [Gluconacetobacter entanii]MBE7620484.1 ABC transporter substrate-binding protein [Komagataeibacter sp. FXV2]MBY4641638.1 ABC transporter substrate-binding protein [Gluconacetobacter entanii]MCW4578993.1 ABC transporter substrate-binding protein [Gluconacetobacter entanii]MCW4582392.1 ABC transporter substrate-binding protein [Gluconacetobacter entanii]MCW4585777.1 ABC transporter substrate-binding protein [Gluconacetobacter entanii]
MQTSFTRRHALGLLTIAGTLSVTAPVHAVDSGAQARTFVHDFGNKLVAIVNNDISLSQKKQQIEPLLDQNVDVDAIGRYCIGRYWRIATPEQQTHYLQLFHQVLVNAITDKIGDYRGVSFTVGQTAPSGEDIAVSTVINRPGQPPANTEWVISSSSGTPKVVDVVGEGASLRLTQRQDYSSYIARNGGNVDALLHALTKQLANHH